MSDNNIKSRKALTNFAISLNKKPSDIELLIIKLENDW